MKDNTLLVVKISFKVNTLIKTGSYYKWKLLYHVTQIIFLLKKIISFILHLCNTCLSDFTACICACVYHMYTWHPHRSEKSITYPETGVTDDYGFMGCHVSGRNQSHVPLCKLSSSITKPFSNGYLLDGNLLICIPYFLGWFILCNFFHRST